ncbi:MAG TPA: 2-dehydropantoate 2-reductase [Stellaceae bacterium]|jgi:2-dehydropantoate 2-reductase|nr:2-dehydropantoate 2-reductase [Stellaceae bacterium]
MKICVYGVGAIGGHLLGRLAAKGDNEVAAVARGANLAALKANGIRVKTPRGEIAGRVAATDDPKTLGVQDAVVVAVKAPALPSIVDGLRTLIGPATSVAFVMNGIPWWYLQGSGGALDGKRLAQLDAHDALLETVGVKRAIGGVIYGGCDAVAPGVVQVEAPQTRLILGHPDDRKSASIEALAAALRADDFVVEASPNIRRDVWAKLQVNITSGLFACLTDQSIRDAYEEPMCQAAVRSLVDEVVALAAALGCTTGFNVDRLARQAGGQQRKTSIALDLELHRPIEFDAMFGAPLELARRLNVSVPTFDLLAGLLKLRARAVGSYPAS